MLIVLRPYRGGNIGNYLFHLCHGVMYAQIEQGTVLIPKPVAFRSMNPRAVALDFSPGRRSYNPGKIEKLGAFIHGNEATRLLSFKYRYFCMQEHLKPLFDPDAGHEVLGDDTLAIHIRSGDIFRPGGSNRKYGQPPLSWYELLIERSGYRDVVVVTQDQFAAGATEHGGPNPVIAEIRKRWPRVRIVAGDTESDFHTLRHARHLALSTGTFGLTAAMLNTRLAQLHVPRYERPKDPNFSDIFNPGADLGFTRHDYQIHHYEDMHSWENRPEQLRLMLNHRIEDISCSQEFPSA